MSLQVHNYATGANKENVRYENLHNFSPADTKILALIMRFLPLSDLYRHQQVCRKFLQAANYSIVWERKAKELEVPETYAPDLQVKARVRRFIKECSYIRYLYPHELCEALGGAKNILSFPKLSLGNKRGISGLLDFVSPEMMIGAKIKRGIDDKGRPFVSLAAKILPRSSNEPVTLAVVTLYKRYLGTSDIWVSGARNLSFIPRSSGDIRALNAKSYEFVAKLVRGEPCTYNDIPNHHGVLLTDQQE